MATTKVYITQQGDTWDALALEFLGDEYLMVDLIRANPLHRTTIVFGQGVELVVPDIEIDEFSDLPEWLEEDDSVVDDDSMEGKEGEDDNGIVEFEGW